MARQYVEWIEIDIPRCTLTWGVGACTAALSAATPRKCYQTFGTCGKLSAFAPADYTVVIFPPVVGAPVNSMPCLDGRIDETEATVNIAGADPTISAFGRRGTIGFTCIDHTDSDLWWDKYHAGRIDGTAQIDEAGYDPATRGTVFQKLKARWPHFAGRACRKKEGYIEADGTLTTEATKHYLLTDFETDKPGRAVFKGRDILDVAGNDRALAPKVCRGKLAADIADDDSIYPAPIELTLTPAGIGDDDYAASGRAVIGSEIVSFTRVGDVMTITARGLAGTETASHTAGTSVQQTLYYDNVRADLVAADLLTNFAPVPSASIPTAAWDAEMQVGAAALMLTAEITKPTNVSTLVAELGLLGLSFWWDGATATVGLKTNRPVYNDVVWEITDDDIVRDGLELQSRDDKRLTEVLFQSVQVDPTKGIADDNFLNYEYTIDGDAKDPNAYGDSRLQVETIRWLNQGDDSTIRILSLRYLKRFSTAPGRITVTVKRDQYRDIALTDVVYLTSRYKTDSTGKAERLAYQVISKQRSGQGLVQLMLQRYFYTGRFGYCMANGSPGYNTASAAQRLAGNFPTDATLVFSDGTGPYVAI